MRACWTGVVSIKYNASCVAPGIPQVWTKIGPRSTYACPEFEGVWATWTVWVDQRSMVRWCYHLYPREIFTSIYTASSINCGKHREQEKGEGRHKCVGRRGISINIGCWVNLSRSEWRPVWSRDEKKSIHSRVLQDLHVIQQLHCREECGHDRCWAIWTWPWNSAVFCGDAVQLNIVQHSPEDSCVNIKTLSCEIEQSEVQRSPPNLRLVLQ